MKGSRKKTAKIDPIRIALMTVTSGVTAALSTVIALAVPVAVIVFIVLPLVPSSAHLVETYVCDPGWVMDLESWEEYDPDEQTTEVGTAIVCYNEADGTWIDVETDVILSLIGLGLLIPGALAGAIGLFLGFISGLHPERKKKRTEKKARPDGKRSKRAKHQDVKRADEKISGESAPPAPEDSSVEGLPKPPMSDDK